MPISVSCPSCAAKFKAPDQAAGRTTKCPKCGGAIQIAAAALPLAVAAPAPSAPVAPKPAVRLPVAQAIPPLAQELPLAQPLAAGLPHATPLPLAHAPAAERNWTSLLLWIVLGVVGFMLFVGYVIAPLVLKGNGNNSVATNGKADGAASDEDLPAFEAAVQQVHEDYTIPANEKKPPRPPTTYTPRDLQLLYAINGDRLRMTTEEFRTKYRHPLKGDSRPSPMMSDHRHREARRNRPLETLSEQEWDVDANNVHARITWPFEDNQNSPYTPSLGTARATDHRFMFVDEQLWRMQFLFPSTDFATVRQAVIAQLGPPAATPSKFGLALRGAFPGEVLSWNNQLAEVDLIEHTMEGDKSFLLVRDLKLEKVHDSRRPGYKGPPPEAVSELPATQAAPPQQPPPKRILPPLIDNRKSPPDVLNGDKLGMRLADFKTKYRRVSETNGLVYPLTTDTLTAQMRERSGSLGLREEPWNAPAKVVKGIVASPQEVSAQTIVLPIVGTALTYSHTYRFIDEKLYRIEMTVDRDKFQGLVKLFTEKYGPPGKAPEAMLAAYTKKNGGELVYWRQGETELFLVERFGENDRTLLNFSNLPLSNEAAKRRTMFKDK